jgi:hypothetical protein
LGGTTLRPRDWRSFLTGAAMGIVAVRLLPIVKQAAHPVARGLIAGAVELGYKTSTMVAQAREELDNMVAEARFAQEPPGAGAAAGSLTESLPDPQALVEHRPDGLT